MKPAAYWQQIARMSVLKSRWHTATQGSTKDPAHARVVSAVAGQNDTRLWTVHKRGLDLGSYCLTWRHLYSHATRCFLDKTMLYSFHVQQGSDLFHAQSAFSCPWFRQRTKLS